MDTADAPSCPDSEARSIAKKLLEVWGTTHFILVSLLVLSLSSHLIADKIWGRIALEFLFCLVLISGLSRAIPTGRILIMARLLAVVVLILGAWGHLSGIEDLHFVAACIRTPFLGLVAWGLLVFVLQKGQITPDRLSGAVCVYLIAALVFASVFLIVEECAPGSFSHTEVAERNVPDRAAPGNSLPASQRSTSRPSPDRTKFLKSLTYFSFTTLTTLGYGDIHPVRPFARSLTSMEALFGQLFLAILVARLVGLQITHGSRED